MYFLVNAAYTLVHKMCFNAIGVEVCKRCVPSSTLILEETKETKLKRRSN